MKRWLRFLLMNGFRSSERFEKFAKKCTLLLAGGQLILICVSWYMFRYTNMSVEENYSFQESFAGFLGCLALGLWAYEICLERYSEKRSGILTRQFHHEIPKHFELIGYFIIPASQHDEQLGDLEEKFHTLWLPKCGLTWARWIYRKQMLDHILMALGYRVRRGLVWGLGLLGFDDILELIKNKLR